MELTLAAMRKHGFSALTLATVLGLALGVSADFVADDHARSANDIMGALVLAPFLTIMGWFGTPPASVIAGFFFWPVWLGLGFVWYRSRNPRTLALVALWSTMGFLHLLCRFDAAMSV